MRVADWMNKALVVVTPDVPVKEAMRLLQEKRIRHLPVVEKEELVGIITDRDLRSVTPSPATSLSIYEINYLLDKLTVREVMTKKVFTVSPEAELEEAARLILERKIGALPVVKDRTLVGIITETDLLRAFLEGRERRISEGAETPRRI